MPSGCRILWIVKLKERIKTSRNSLKESVRLFRISKIVALKSLTRRSGTEGRKWNLVEVKEADESWLGNRYRQPIRTLQFLSDCKEIREKLMILWGTGEK